MKKVILFILCLVFCITFRLYFGIYEDDEFDETHVFIKHRPIWKWKFYSPRGMSDLKNSEMKIEKRKEQELFDEFILGHK